MNKFRYKTQGSITSDLAGVVCQPSRMASSFIRCKVQDARYKVQGYFLASCPLPLASVQRGFSLISAIFLLVVIAALGTFAVTLSTTQQQSAALDVLGSRAYQAARAGIEWGAYQALINNSCALNASNTPLPALPNTLANFTVTVSCIPAAASEASATVTMYQLTSTAKQGAVTTPNYVERQMSVTIAK
jgi:MSHA biogenesis protein MshP